MSTATKDFISKLKNMSEPDCKKVTAAVDEFLRAPRDEVVKRLIEISHEVGDNMLGWFIFPGLKRRAAIDKDLLPEIQKLVRQDNVPVNVRLHCIDLIDKIFREKKISCPQYVEFICDTAANPEISVTVRARIARLLPRVPKENQLETLKILIDSKEAPLVEAACHTMYRWSKNELGAQNHLVKGIMDFAKSSPGVAIKNPNILRTLAQSNQSESIDNIIENTKIKEGNDWLRLARCIGPDTPTELLAKIIGGITEIRGPQSRIAIQNLFIKYPLKLESLYNEEYYREFIDSVAAYPSTLGEKVLSYLEDIEQKVDSEISNKAAVLRQDLTTARRRALLPKDRRLDRMPRPAGAGTPLPSKEKINESYSTGFQMGDALYRDTYLDFWFLCTTNHWHAGIFQTFELEHNGSGIGHMQGVQMTGFPGDVVPFTAQNGFGYPACNVADKMEVLYKAFLEAFFLNDNHDDLYYHGARRTPVMSKDDRSCLYAISADLMNRGIHYTFWDMLVPWGYNWDGELADIALLRCDGVVEYAYEKCNKKVCAGKDASKWNIAAAGNDYLESHEDVHTVELDTGELCPRVQAGDEGTDTTFIIPDPSAPIILDFAVYEAPAPAGTGNIIAIKLNVQSREYNDIYVRIIVRPVGGPFDFAITTGATGVPSGVVGPWMFKEVDEGTNHFAYWPGKTSGPDYYGNNQTYEFRAVAVDKGGNVSEEYSYEITIDWSQLKPEPW